MAMSAWWRLSSSVVSPSSLSSWVPSPRPGSARVRYLHLHQVVLELGPLTYVPGSARVRYEYPHLDQVVLELGTGTSIFTSEEQVRQALIAHLLKTFILPPGSYKFCLAKSKLDLSTIGR